MAVPSIGNIASSVSRSTGGLAGGTGPAARPIPDFGEVIDEMLLAEEQAGWLAMCEQRGEHLVVNRPLVQQLAAFLCGLSARPVLEVCAGGGRLALALREVGVDVIAVDSDPGVSPAVFSPPVVRATAAEALGRFRPSVVLGSFVPVDSGIDEQVMRFPSVEHYVVLGARLGGVFGTAALWRSGWRAQRLEAICRYMTTRHDVYLGDPDRPILQHGEVWHFRRSVAAEDSPRD